MNEADIPAPPWKRRTREPKIRSPLTQDAIVEAALRILERDGIDGLSMRTVAGELGAGTATLYWHVGSKDELIELVIDRVFAQIELPPPEPGRWQEQLKEVAIEARRVLQRYRGVGALTLGRIPTGPTMFRWIEWSLGLLRSAGLPDRIAAYAGDLFGLYLGAHAFEDASPVASPTGQDLPPDEIVTMIRKYFESLPEDVFPNIRATADALTSGDAEERFELGLDVIIRGLASYTDE